MKEITLALAGQANVGKSVIFNHLTGLHQHIGNWPGKTVEKAEGTLFYKGYFINVIDLPGIYSLSHYSIEELISREFIAKEKPDVVVNIVDTTAIERHLIFTLQLLELERPLILVLNMMDLAEKKGIAVDFEELERELGVPVVPMIATRGKGLTDMLDKAIELAERGFSPKVLGYGREIELRIRKLMEALDDVDLPYPKRWIAIKLLEKDEEVQKLIKEIKPEVLKLAEKMIQEIQEVHGHDSSIAISNERVNLANYIAQKVVKISASKKLSLGERFDEIATHPVFGYLFMALVFIGVFFLVFGVGGEIAGIFEEFTENLNDVWFNFLGESAASSLGWAAVESFFSLMGLVIPFIAPLYLILFLLENWGYLARVSFLMDSLMHKAGIHGKASIPLILGFGCNVPACLSSKIMETWRERFITVFMTTLIPCSAVTVVVMGLVGRYVGISWVIGLYVFTLLMVMLLGRLVSKMLPGEAVELIMEMPSYKAPNLKTTLIMTWLRLREYFYIAMPLVVLSGVIINALDLAGILPMISEALSPITVGWLNLPKEVGLLLIFGILRKELILLMLTSLVGTMEFSKVLTANQMITLSLVTIFYIPCIATISALFKEVGVKNALIITIAEITLAIFIGGVASRILLCFGVS
ncbi:MAG: ferrous iron transport protein B [Thaumarchaeota archaeon]|nr:ferrous iron transport protein B [Nitrososphaerota archaeon]